MTTEPDLIEALPDLTLTECCDRWGITRNAVKARAEALGVLLVAEASNRTVWPAAHVALGDRLQQHLASGRGASMATFPERLSVPPAGGSSDGTELVSVPPAGGSSTRRSGLSVPPAGGSSDALVAALTALQSLSVPPAGGVSDALSKVRQLAEAADDRLPLPAPVLAELLQLEVPELEAMRSGQVVLGFRLRRRGGGRWWLVERAATD